MLPSAQAGALQATSAVTAPLGSAACPLGMETMATARVTAALAATATAQRAARRGVRNEVFDIPQLLVRFTVK
ncbi:hypothetical protein Cs7R123_50380 [Catellatospora sp. TT07R-123]|nr:hypothetical protein Cs7R123_50380 [Catellatospora sp. TT07R-123]